MELSLCHEHGIPHSEFLNWDPDDKSKALAFLLEKAAKCDMCGTAEWEWDADRKAYEPVEKFCMGCYLKHMVSEGGGQMPGTTVVMEPTRTQKTAKRHAQMRREHRNG